MSRRPAQALVIRLLVSAAAVLALGTSGLAAPAPSTSGSRLTEIPLESSWAESETPLTTERAWELDPREANPHRQRWLFPRKTEILGLEAWQPTQPGTGSQKKPQPYRVRASGIRSVGVLYLRGPGPWYRPFTEFSCLPEPDAWFATRQGAEVAGKEGADSWSQVLGREKLKLQLRLDRIRGSRAEEVLQRARDEFASWLREVEQEWRSSSRSKARIAEWRWYLQQGQKIGQCKLQEVRKAAAPAAAPPAWHELMEPVRPEPTRKVLARAPAKRWGGLYSIRLSVIFGDKTLNGQFLIDSGAAVSVVSPTWLESQGINPLLVERRGFPSQRVAWSGGSGIARKALAFQVSVADYILPLSEFLLMETELFGPPQYAGSCCDGILGNDFLHLYALELHPGPPASVAILDRRGFSGGKDMPWVEAATLPSGELVSSGCLLESSSGASPIVAARWDTGSEMALEPHLPWVETVRKGKAPWRLSCPGLKVAEGFPLTVPHAEKESPSSPVRTRVPGFNVGMEILGRGPTILDVPNGRIWFDRASLAKPVLENRSGLDTEFEFGDGNTRELVVRSLRKGSPADALSKAGLRPGMRITKVDGIPVAELNTWLLERRLAGSEGSRVTVEWSTKGGAKVAPLELQPQAKTRSSAQP